MRFLRKHRRRASSTCGGSSGGSASSQAVSQAGSAESNLSMNSAFSQRTDALRSRSPKRGRRRNYSGNSIGSKPNHRATFERPPAPGRKPISNTINLIMQTREDIEARSSISYALNSSSYVDHTTFSCTAGIGCVKHFSDPMDWFNHERKDHPRESFWQCNLCKTTLDPCWEMKYYFHNMSYHPDTHLPDRNPYAGIAFSGSNQPLSWCGFCQKFIYFISSGSWNGSKFPMLPQEYEQFMFGRFLHIKDHFVMGSSINEWIWKSLYPISAFGHENRDSDSIQRIVSTDDFSSSRSSIRGNLPQKDKAHQRYVSSHDAEPFFMDKYKKLSRESPPSLLGSLTGRKSFPCTFCHKLISIKSWKRHEETQHLPHLKESWMCMPQGSHVASKEMQDYWCGFCGSVCAEHLSDVSCHRIQDCLARPAQERTFSRRDHFKQHFNEFHKAVLSNSTALAWKIDGFGDGGPWNCGFCDDILQNWDARAAHISKHFREGKTMVDWK
jgi:hypothetical protein